jgi:hypothetical protein
MAVELKLEGHRTASNSDNFAKLSGTIGRKIVKKRADLRLEVSLNQHNKFSFLLFGKDLDGSDVDEGGVSERTDKEVFAISDNCRREWVKHIIDFERPAAGAVAGKETEKPFQYFWNFRKEAQLLKSAAPNLAYAGNMLFSLIFELKGNAELKQLGQKLRTIMASGSRYLAVTSDELFLPWGMIYTHPIDKGKLKEGGSNFEKEGFWGYQHIIQHNTRRFKFQFAIPPDDGAVALSINFDEKISSDRALPAADRRLIASHLQFISELGRKPCIKRTKKIQLQQDFTTNRNRLERIIYFYCHGRGSTDADNFNLAETQLTLTDDAVSSYDFQTWSNSAELPSNPLVFINACQGGQMTTLFYKSLARELLEEGAAGLVGAQIDIPAVFAAVYGRKVFKQFFARKKAPVRLGPLLKEINQYFWDKHNNPLGLVYSLYRGVDCFIDWPPA